MLEASACEWQPAARYYNAMPAPSPYYPPYNMGYPQHPYQPTASHMHPHQMQMHHTSGVYAPNAALMESFITSSSTRLQRNFAEKQRRTKLNTYIDELRSLVPMVSSSVAARSGKKVDKTSILRLAATYLRQHQILYGNKGHLSTLPPELNDFNWSQFLLHDMDGILLLVTSAGKIVFISHTIDKVLGHNQTELFGQSLYSFTCPEDHDELRRNLSPDLDPANLNPTPVLNNGSYCELSGDEAESCASGSSPRSCGSGPSAPSLATSTERQRRSFYLRLRQKGCSRSEKPQYELVHVVGHLRITRRTEEGVAGGGGVVSRRSRKTREMNMSSNDVVLVAVIKPFKERRLTSLSLIESTREEYITRHLKDGRIIYCDHRISFVSGYLSTEISGLSGFMFMHKEDMKWAMIALRQMYIKNESYGTSCYRLVDKTGKFFYIKTHGYLEFDPYEQASEDYIPSFICINTLISEEEGEMAIRSMRQRFTPLIESKVDTGTLAIAESLSQDKCSQSSRGPGTDSSPPLPLPSTPSSELSDPDELKLCTKSLISTFPTHGSKPVSCNLMGDDSQYYKLVVAAKAMPPVSLLTAKMGLKATKSISSVSSSLHKKEEVLNAPVQNRPSVLRGPMRVSERSAVITTTSKRHRDEDLYIDSEVSNIRDKKPRSSYEGEVLVSPQSSSSVSSFCQSPIEAVSTTDDVNTTSNSNSTYLNLDVQDGMEIRNIIEAPSFIVDEESEEELKHTPVHSSEMFPLWEETSKDISSLDKSSLRLPGLEYSSLNMNGLHHKSPNSGGHHTFPS